MNASEFLEDVKAFSESEIRPFATQFELAEAVPRDLIVKLAKRGFLAPNLPARFGGLDLDPLTYGHFTKELNKACCSTRTLITVHSSLVGEAILKWGTEKQKEEWLPSMASAEKLAAFALSEPEVGSDAKSVRTSYEQRGTKFILNGRKKWISFGGIADIFLVFAHNHGEHSAFVVEKKMPGVHTRPIKGLLAARASHLAEVEFINVEVPAENLLGKLGTGFNYIVSSALDHGRYSIAWAGVGLAEGALEEMINYSRSRSQFGKKIYNFQLIQGIIANAVTQTHAARSLCIAAGEMRKNKANNADIETSIAKYFSSKIAMQVTTDAVQVLGGNGCCNEYDAERLFREAKILEIIEGTSQIQQEVISMYALNKYFRKNVRNTTKQPI